MRTKQFGMILLGLSLALVTSCSKEEVEKPVDNSEPVVPMKKQELTGVFEGEWNYDELSYPIVVNDGYIFADELPVEGIFKRIRGDMLSICDYYPEKKAAIIDSIGNIFFASSYKYPMTDLQIKYELGDYSAIDGIYYAKMLSIKNKLSDIATTICIDREPPYPSETIVIDAPEPNTISFDVKADGIPYRIDLVSKEHDVNMEFHMKPQLLGDPVGLWVIQYWFNTFRVINMMTGQQYDMDIMNYGYPRRHNKEDTNLLQFQAKEKTGSAEERIIPYI